MPEAVSFMKKRYNLDEEESVIATELNEIIKYEYENNLKLKPHALKFVRYLCSAGKKLYVATATYEKLARIVLERNGVLGYFEGLVSCSSIGVGKDKPDIFLEASKLLKLPPEKCIVFEDSLYAIKTANAAGFKTVGVYDTVNVELFDEINEITDGQMVLK